jgi:hypothetical protein
LECGSFTLSKFYAPNISRLYTVVHHYPVSSISHTFFYKDLRDLHLQGASVHALCLTIVSLPRLEIIAVDEIRSWFNAPATRSYSATLESMTLPLPSSHDSWPGFIDMFSLLHLPIFRKLTLVGAPTKRQFNCLLSMLAVASFQVPVVDFQTDVPLRKFHMKSIDLLLSAVGEVAFRG